MKKGELTLEHRAPVREQRGKGSATPAGTAAGPGQTPGSPQPGAGPRGGQTAWPSSPKWGCPAVQHTHLHTHPGRGGEEAAPAQSESREHPGEAQAGPGGRAVGGGSERERRGRGRRAWGGTWEGNSTQILCWPLPASAARDPGLSPLIWRPLMPCRSSTGQLH